MTARLSSLLESARVVALPLRNRFRGLEVRELMLFEGPNGWTEWAAFPEYEDEEASLWLAAAIEWGFEELPKPIRSTVGVNAILPAVGISEIEKVLDRAGQFKTIKIKVAEVGQTLDQDMERIQRVKQLRPDCQIRLDANGGYTIQSSIELLQKLADMSIELQYFEQPVASIAELAELRLTLSKLGLRTLIAADESVRRSTDPLAVEIAAAADVLVLKSAPLGGIKSALAVAAASNLKIAASSALQSSVGLAAELHFAASLPKLEFDSGLGTSILFAGDLVKEPLIPGNGMLELRRPEINLAALDSLKAEDHRRDFWIDRLKRCARILGLES